MSLSSYEAYEQSPGFPRSRGDEPGYCSHGASRQRFPRSRGDEPLNKVNEAGDGEFSPLTRG